jgi:hypothetical protein
MAAKLLNQSTWTARCKGANRASGAPRAIDQMARTIGQANVRADLAATRLC